MHHPTGRITHTTAFGALAGKKNSSMSPPRGIDPMTHRTMSEGSYHRPTSHSTVRSVPQVLTPGVFL